MDETFSIEAPDDVDEVRPVLREFFAHNGYTAVDDTPMTLRRGRRGAGWWSSNMTDLHTELVIDAGDDPIRLRYEVDTAGQILSEEDRAFWRREAEAAEQFLHQRDELVDLREAEKKRAKEVQSEHRRLGLVAMVIVFLVVFASTFTAEHLACI